jgi:hypothetical protein
MANLCNDENSLSISLDLIKVDDCDSDVSDAYIFINYILSLISDYEAICITDKAISCRTMDYFLRGIKNIIELKINKKKIMEPFEMNPLDNSFYLKVSERGLDNLVCVEIWFNIAILTSGAIIGYKKGFQFDIFVDTLQTFYTSLLSEYCELHRLREV